MLPPYQFWITLSPPLPQPLHWHCSICWIVLHILLYSAIVLWQVGQKISYFELFATVLSTSVAIPSLIVPISAHTFLNAASCPWFSPVLAVTIKWAHSWRITSLILLSDAVSNNCFENSTWVEYQMPLIISHLWNFRKKNHKGEEMLYISNIR